jgi:hypothetical protein
MLFISVGIVCVVSGLYMLWARTYGKKKFTIITWNVTNNESPSMFSLESARQLSNDLSKCREIKEQLYGTDSDIIMLQGLNTFTFDKLVNGEFDSRYMCSDLINTTTTMIKKKNNIDYVIRFHLDLKDSYIKDSINISVITLNEQLIVLCNFGHPFEEIGLFTDWVSEAYPNANIIVTGISLDDLSVSSHMKSCGFSTIDMGSNACMYVYGGSIYVDGGSIKHKGNFIQIDNYV